MIGYDTDYTIVQRTQTACSRLQKNGTHCEEPNITIIPVQKIRSCEGHIIHKNHIDNTTSIMFPL